MMNTGCVAKELMNKRKSRIISFMISSMTILAKTIHQTTVATQFIIRVCSECNTTKTPLWRSDPQGPKSLCNSCGIRQKARPAMAAANNGMVLAPDDSTTRTKMQNKEKKTRTSYNTWHSIRNHSNSPVLLKAGRRFLLRILP
ncbi:hypothetical protein CsSME_00044265 [Camellia sinensis var. sinensis]